MRSPSDFDDSEQPGGAASARNEFAAPGGTVGAVVQAGAVHGDVHIHTGSRGDPPRQVPLAPRHFTDRVPEQAALSTAVRGARADRLPRVVVVSGPGGVGKTALAAHFLHRAADSFPDGILYADLRGFAPGAPPVDPGDVLDRFLRSLHTEAGAIPFDPAARAAEFRSRTAGRTLAILLDNAASAAQVRMLLPGGGPHVVVVTTRLRLAGLAFEGASFLQVGPLAGSAAAQLVARVLGDDRPRREADAVDRLVALCGRLPLALCAAASRLALRPHQSVGRLVDQLDTEQGRIARLSRHQEPEESSVQAVFDTSYAHLDPTARRLYRLLGLPTGPDVTLPAAAALLGADEERAEDAVDALVAASLLEEHAAGRYRQHDLARLHARDRLAADEPPEEREEARRRLGAYFLDSAVNADLVLNPGRWHLGPRFGEERGGEQFTDRASAVAWLEAELPNLRAWIAACNEAGDHASCWQLCEALRTFFVMRKHFDMWETTHAVGLSSARALGDPAAEALVLGGLGGLHTTLGNPVTAREHQRAALVLWERVGHLLGQATALEALGVTDLVLGEPDSAAARFRRALDIHRGLGHERGIALMRRRMGEAARDQGDHEAAEAYFDRALEFFTEDAEPYMRVRTLVGLAASRLAHGEAPAAEEALAEALRIGEDVGARAEVAGIHVMRADAASAAGRSGAVRTHLSTALSIYTELGAPQAAVIRQRIADLPPPPAS
ncbi:tetratricopeptide repeat protein [Streptomonospora nanhaiensis]|uniref:Tetratricopeptide (TPR) repeat protein n=1 Tax=Streptomonospora nanhaiensis TaxID=1323731 RepID=A0A853BR73_9ACTN|nr:tetratricopeptide repeat protein [Streptomonospora nanhaiensis]MBX9386912.1 tetratricopeptide repeat protein [Streptomonospora nanhaiensis]NYI98229.1 tetratricopeptide (TPR) repeat protein [Streptomonospora nanhaiensis]